jgi:hypothetical protein
MATYDAAGVTMQSTDASRDLADLLDKLVSIDLDLEPIRKMDGDASRLEFVAGQTIGRACEILRGAIDELRDVIYKIDGAAYLAPESDPPLESRNSL